MKKRNKLDNLKSFEPMREAAPADQPPCIELDQDVDAAVGAIPDKSTWSGNVIESAAINQGLIWLEHAISDKNNSTDVENS